MLAAYGIFSLGTGFDLAKLRAAAAGVFPGDDAAQIGWSTRSSRSTRSMRVGAGAATRTWDGRLRFSVIEALYARGFTSATTITALSGDEFAQAITGTVAFDSPGDLYVRVGLAPPVPAAPVPGGFRQSTRTTR